MSENEFSESKESFVNYLNNEIEQIREDIKMPGWTNWAVLAALASAGWFIILELEKNIFNTEQFYLLFILTSMAYIILRDIYDFLKPDQSNKKTRFFTVEIIFREKRLTFAVNIIHASLMMFLLIRFSNKVSALPFYFSLIYYGFIILSPAIGILIDKAIKRFTNANFYIPDMQTSAIPFNVPPALRNTSKPFKGGFIIPSIIFSLAITYSLFSYALFYFHSYGLGITDVTISSLKMAILSFSIFLLIKLWVYSEQTSPTLKELLEIRRDLIFGNINLDMAKKLTEISISGLNKSAIIQREVTNCIVTLQGIDSELNKAAQKNQIAISQIQDSNESQQILWETMRDAILVHLRQARTIYLSDKGLRGGLGAFLKIYAPMEPEDMGFVESLRKMAELYIEVKKKYDETIFEWLKLAVKYEGVPKSNKWKDVAINELKAEIPEIIISQKDAG